MSRAIWKGNFIDKSILKLKDKEKSYIRIMSRRSVIPEFLVGKNVYIYNGNSFTSLAVDEECVGYKFGEFSFTRTYTPLPEDRRKQRQMKMRKKIKPDEDLNF